MFGYLRPDKNELKIKDYELYKSVYCGLCKHLGKDYGIISRLTLSYDCTVLAMLYISLKNEKPCVNKGRCVVNPLKKCAFCDCEGEGFRFAGAVSVIMTYYKLSDTIADSGFFKSAGAGILKAFLKRSYKKAAKAYPLTDECAAKMMELQLEAEKSECTVDKAADPTASMLSSLCKSMVDEEDPRRKTLEVFGYFLGRWIYLMDAADDLEKDIRKKQFNPFKNDCDGEIKKAMLHCNDVLNMTAAQIVLAYDLLDQNCFKDILDNIVYDGVSFQQKYHLFEKRKNKKEKNTV